MEDKTEFNAETAEDSTPLDLNVAEMIHTILEEQQKISRRLMQVLRENVNFQNQVRGGMQEELEIFREQQRGEQFTPILKAIAAVCVEYRSLLDDESIMGRSRRKLQLLFDELEDILADYDAEVFTSAKGEPRRALLTKIINTIATANPELHNKVAKSRRAGVVRNGRPLYREYVDVYVFDAALVNVSKSEFATNRE
ncbi:MAG: hypothetical protein IJS29_09585 [Selenomonadaceae bacterium]|nr:hypothetical protein [Selenomonadaceae bacterium]